MRGLPALMVLALLAVALASGAVASARISGIVILVDMSHGQNPGGLHEMLKLVPEAYWIILVAKQGDEKSLPPGVLKLADEIRYGGFTSSTLQGVDMVLIGQPTVLPDPAELDALAKWFKGKGVKALWVAGDSDYPAQGSETAQQFANQVLEAIGSRLRLDYVSVEDEKSNANATYRVIGIVDPTPKAEPCSLTSYVASRVLFHGPGAVYALDANGKPVNPITTPVQNVCVIARTTEAGKIVEHQTAAGGGLSGVLYQVGQTGMFPLLAMEIVSTNPWKAVIASGESPYSGYQAGITWEYYDQRLDGPNFFRYLIYLAVGYMAPFKPYMELESLSSNLAAARQSLNQAQASINTLKSSLDSLSGSVSSLSSRVDQLSSQVSSLQSSLDTVKSDVSAASDTANSASSRASNALAVGVLALIIALGAAGLALTRRK